MTLWQFSPNWRESYSIAYEFKTDIFVSRSGKEQRRAARSTPRRTITFTVTRAAAEYRKLNATLKAAQGAAVTMADHGRHVRTVSPTVSGATTLAVSSVPDWLIPGAVVALADRDGYAKVTISAVAPNAVLTLAAPLGRAWSEPKIHPVATGWFDQSLEVKQYGDRIAEADIAFAGEPGIDTIESAGSAEEVFNRREVLLLDPNFATPVAGSFKRTRDAVDFGRGRIATFLPVAFTFRTKQYNILAPSQAERSRIVSLFLRMKGQRGEFYLPSFDDDFTIVAAPTTLTVRVSGTQIDAVYHGDALHRAVMIRRGQNRYYRRIVASSHDGMHTTLTSDRAWPCPLDGEARLSWLVVHRFATDQLSVESITDEVSRTQFSVSTLEDLGVSDTDAVFPGLSPLAANLIDDWGFGAGFAALDAFNRIVPQYAEITEGVFE